MSRRILIACVVTATLGYYYWTATVPGGGEMPPIHGAESDYFNLLSRGFRQGHLHLDAEVPAALRALANPYDPAQRGNLPVLHDASYYRGHYYIYFGPAPVVTLLLPFNLITGRDLPIAHAVWVFSAAGYLALAGSFLFLQRRHFPDATPWAILTGLMALGGANMAVALLRRANIWELSAAAGFCFFAASLYGLLRAVHAPRPMRWAALGGLALGLAVASRPTYLLCALVFAVPLALRWLVQGRISRLSVPPLPRRATGVAIRLVARFGRSGTNRQLPDAPAAQTRATRLDPGGATIAEADPHPAPLSYDLRALLAAAVGSAAILLPLLAYNQARFDHPLEFGQKYQLTGANEAQNTHFSLTYLPYNFRLYFLSALRWVPQFPFHQGIEVPPLPPGHGGHEYVFGLLPNLPFSLFALVALGAVVMRWIRRAPQPALDASLAAIAAGAALNAGLLLIFFGLCIRYLIDFVPQVMLLASVGGLEGERWLTTHDVRSSGNRPGLPPGNGRQGRLPLRKTALCGALALGLALFSALVAGLSVVNFYNDLEGETPRAYHPIARALNWPAFRLWSQRWPAYAPLEIELTLPADRPARPETLATVNRDDGARAAVFVDYLDDGKIRLGYRERDGAGLPIFSTALAAPRGFRHTLRLSVGGPYADFNGAKGRLRAQIDDRVLWDQPAVSFGVYPGNWHVAQTGGAASPRPAFTGTIHAARAITLGDLPRPTVAGIRTRLTLTAAMAGRAFPLVTTGRTKAGDMFFIRVLPDDRVAFGYDHWGDAPFASPEIPWRLGASRVVEFWLPALSRPAAKPNLIVRVDGITVWEQHAPAFPVSPETVFVGSNPIGGSNCERVLENGVFEDLQLPPPGPQVSSADVALKGDAAAIRIRLTFDPSMTGRSFPLVTTGRTEAGDLLFIRLHAGEKVSFGYDHWAAPLMISPEIPWRAGETRLIECRVPALSPAGTPPALVVKIDGITVWDRNAPAFPATPETTFIGSNPIGGSTCERTLVHGSVEAAVPATVRHPER